MVFLQVNGYVFNLPGSLENGVACFPVEFEPFKLLTFPVFQVYFYRIFCAFLIEDGNLAN